MTGLGPFSAASSAVGPNGGTDLEEGRGVSRLRSMSGAAQVIKAVLPRRGRSFFRPGGFAAAVNLTGKFSPLVFGSSEEATTALGDFLCVDSAEHHLNLSRGTLAIVAEVEAMLADAKRRVAESQVSSSL